ncbi:hypothetical protein MVEN_01427800 [Mycena venus]|uniref:Glycoside hydrolase family 78 protein n=1 Tax=Mycena venus TaxID=2733690 RepID=A0A8H7CSX5_9AGAR|nr:hypothetical protein MVEN_01427800 [Mycena venus]
MASLLFSTMFTLLLATLALSGVPNDGTSTSVARRATASTLNFDSSDWIWTSTITANTFVGLRKDFTPSTGKALIATDIIMSADSNMNLFVNGEYVGSGVPPAQYRLGNRFCVDLLPSFNVFAVNASTGTAGNPGLLAAILLTYSDGTTDTLVTDSSWRVHAGLPAGFEQTSFDDTTWAVAKNIGTYQSFGPNDAVVIPQSPPAITLYGAGWIWTDVVPASGKSSCGAARIPSGVYRRTEPDPHVCQHYHRSGQQLYAQYTVNFAAGTNEVVFAVLATNVGSAASTAGLIVAVEINMVPTGRTNCTAGSVLVSGPLWKSTKGAIPTGFEQPEFDDSAWPAVVSQEIYGGTIWGDITIAAPSPPVTI